MRDGRRGFAATDSRDRYGWWWISVGGILTQNLENMEIRPVVARARSTGSAFDHERLSLFHGFEATGAISGDPEGVVVFRKMHWKVGLFYFLRAPLRAWPSPSSLPTAYAVGCILSPLPGWLSAASSSADPGCFLYGKLGGCLG